MNLVFNQLLDAGWRMQEIDEMDFIGYLRLRAWKARRDARQQELARQTTIDQVWPQLC